MPAVDGLERFYTLFEAERGFQFGLQASEIAKEILGISFAEAEEFALSVYRQFLLAHPNANAKGITEAAIRTWQSHVSAAHDAQEDPGSR